jgi:hypothetical protein
MWLQEEGLANRTFVRDRIKTARMEFHKPKPFSEAGTLRIPMKSRRHCEMILPTVPT